VGLSLKYLVDSNIIIYHLNNEPIATEFLSQNYRQIAISQITYVEVLSFPFSDEEENEVKMLLSKFKILDVDQAISNQAVKNRKVKKIKLPDNLIASTVMTNGLTIVTRNVTDFKSFDVEVFNIYEE
jgi:predicted nucleic acid-binding protein